MGRSGGRKERREVALFDWEVQPEMDRGCLAVPAALAPPSPGAHGEELVLET